MKLILYNHYFYLIIDIHVIQVILLIRTLNNKKFKEISRARYVTNARRLVYGKLENCNEELA
jgi:hypothetical protein